jgi:hypothetical protein
MSFTFLKVAKSFEEFSMAASDSFRSGTLPAGVFLYLTGAARALEKQGRLAAGIKFYAYGHENTGEPGHSDFEPSSSCTIDVRAVEVETIADPEPEAEQPQPESAAEPEAAVAEQPSADTAE